MSIEENNLLQKVKDYKESVLDNISPTFCTAKWKQGQRLPYRGY